MKTSVICFLCLASLIVLTGCGGPRVYESELDRRPITSRLEAQDIRRTVEKMAGSLIADEGVAAATAGQKPVLDIEPMKNRTAISVDMKSITDSVRTRLIRSRLFRFVDRSTAGADIAIMDEQAQLGLTNPKNAIRPGQQLAAQMYLTGSLTDITTRLGRTVDHYYKFTMILKDLRSGEIIWTDEQEIRKFARHEKLDR